MRTSFASGLLRCSGFVLLVAGCGSTSQPPAEQHASTAQALSLAPLDCAGLSADWPMFGQNVCNTRSTSSLGGITPATAKNLSLKWSYKAAGDISATPAVVGNELFVPDWGGMLNKLDARTGQPMWAVSIGALIGNRRRRRRGSQRHARARGLARHAGRDGRQRHLRRVPRRLCQPPPVGVDSGGR